MIRKLNDSHIKCFIHDIKTPLISIKHGVIGLKTFLPKLFDAYYKAQLANLMIEEIQPEHLELLYKVLNHLETATDQIYVQLEKLNEHQP